jgi:hypothetical protein
MFPNSRSPFLAQALVCWNWKCALLSASARSIVYVITMAHTGLRRSLVVVLVEIAYVTFTAGTYAAMQQRALGLRNRWIGNSIVTVAVPALAQGLDWLAHRLSGAPATHGTLMAVCVFTFVSALFHLHVMRNGAFLSGCGRSLLDDCRRIPRLLAGFLVKPVVLFANLAASAGVEAENG